MKRFIALLALVTLVGCQPAEKAADPAPDTTAAPVAVSSSDALDAALAAQPDEVRARYSQRHPKETIEFFGIKPGMTVVEGLPGGGWYSKVLLNYLGSEGCLIGANYAMDMWKLFFFASDEYMAKMAVWIDTFKADAKNWGGENGASVEAFYFGSMPESFTGTADVVFFPRVLHNLANFQNAGNGAYLDQALADMYAILKPGGVFGVVQHEARDSMSDEFANGTHGYLKKAWLIEQIEGAGFEFVAESAINENPLDQPTETDIVWRLPPSYNGIEENAEQRKVVDAIGESNRMTLKFRKPK